MGKNVKWKYEPYAFYNKQGIEERLSAMAAEGWFIEKMGMFWKYRKGEPAKRTYNVVYFQDDGIEETTHRQKDFVSYCEAAGWTLSIVTSGMLIFYHGGDDPVPIETEPELELENIHQSMKELHVPRYFMVGMYTMMFLVEMYMEWDMTPLNVLASNRYCFILGYIIAAVFILCDALFYFSWRKRALSLLEEAGIIADVKHRPIHKSLSDITVCLVLLSGTLAIIGSGDYMAYIVVGILLLIVFGGIVKERVKNNRRVQKIKNISMPEIKQPVGFILLMLAGLGLLVSIFLLTYFDVLMYAEQKQIEKAVVTLEDVKDFDGIVEFDTHYHETESILLKKNVFDQSVKEWNHNVANEYIYFDYTYIEVKTDFIYNLAFDKFCEQEYIEFDEAARKLDLHASDASVYQLDGGYLYIWEDAFAEVDFSWEPTEAQLQIVAENLRSVE